VFSNDRIVDARAALPPLMSRDYWFRAWIVQDIAFSRELRIRCGSDEISYSTLVAFQSIEPDKRALRSCQKTSAQRFYGPVRHNRLLEPGLARFDRNISPRMFLDRLLDRQCTDRRDNVFAFYNMFNDDIKECIEIDYEKPREEILIETTRGIIEVTQDLYIITLRGRQSRAKGKEAWQRDILPSWCPYLGKSFKSDSIAPVNSTIFSSRKPVVTFLNGNGTLKARGYRVGIISDTVTRASLSTEQFQSISLTRSNTRGDIGFMTSPERLNVLLSRARDALIMIGNAETFMSSRKGKELWEHFMALLKKGRYIYDGFPVKCERHQNRNALLRRPEDFDEYCPDGGCSEPW
jgi:hypothetical protein